MNHPETHSDYEHDIFRIKDILFRLFPNTKEAFNADWLNKKFTDKEKNKKIGYREYTIIYSGMKFINGHKNKNQHYKIIGNTSKAKEKLVKVIEEVYRTSKCLAFKWEERTTDFEWFELNSPAEMAVVEELNKRNVLFFCNARCLISDRYNEQEKMIPDFLVVYQGKARVLEIDGEEYHKDNFKDYRRDRLFERHGLRVTRYTFDECIADSKRVIDEFLELFEEGINHFYQLARMFRANDPNKYA